MGTFQSSQNWKGIPTVKDSTWQSLLCLCFIRSPLRRRRIQALSSTGRGTSEKKRRCRAAETNRVGVLDTGVASRGWSEMLCGAPDSEPVRSSAPHRLRVDLEAGRLQFSTSWRPGLAGDSFFSDLTLMQGFPEKLRC